MFSSKLARIASCVNKWGQPLFTRTLITDVSVPEDELVQVSESNGVRRISMIDSKTRNSMSLAMTAALHRHITMGTADPSLRCIIISSAGPTFSGGHNLKEISNSNGRQVFYKFGELMLAMIYCPVPIITVIDGIAAAAGCQLVAQSDIAIASNRSAFCTPGVKFGIFCATPAVPLYRSVNKKAAAHMLFTGNLISAEEALKLGLITKAVQDDKLEDEVADLVKELKKKSRVVLQFGKRFFYAQMEMPVHKAYKKGARMMDLSLTFSDGIEGLKSFTEKREPNWKHIPYV